MKTQTRASVHLFIYRDGSWPTEPDGRKPNSRWPPNESSFSPRQRITHINPTEPPASAALTRSTWQTKRMLQEHQQNGERRRCLGSDALLKGSADDFNSPTAELMCTVILVPYSHTYTAQQGAFGLLSTFQKSH